MDVGHLLMSDGQWFNPERVPKCPECGQPCAYELDSHEAEVFDTCGSKNCESLYIAKLEASL